MQAIKRYLAKPWRLRVARGPKAGRKRSSTNALEETLKTCLPLHFITGNGSMFNSRIKLKLLKKVQIDRVFVSTLWTFQKSLCFFARPFLNNQRKRRRVHY